MARTPPLRRVNLVGQRIRQLRRSRRLTQTELSEKIGVQQSDLSRMEKGEYKVGLDTLFHILQVFDLNMAEFFDETGANATEEDRGAWREYHGLSEAAREEIRDFIRFKQAQESGERKEETDQKELGSRNEET